MVFGHFGPFETDMDNFETSMRAVTLSGIVLIGALLCCLIVCLVTMVASLTFSCWWTLGSFFKIGPSGVAQRHGFFSSRQKLLQHDNCKIGNNKCQQKVSSTSIWVQPSSPAADASPHLSMAQNGQPKKAQEKQQVLLNDELETVTAVV